MKKLLIVISSVFLLAACSHQAVEQPNNGIPSVTSVQPSSVPVIPVVRTQEKPSMQIDQAKTYRVTLRTSKGDIVIALSADKTPITVNNFVALSRQGFYDNTIFHRVIKGFMIQGGDPAGNGSGGPGYRFDDEPFEGEYARGTVAMANAGLNTNGSQFFIMHQDYELQKNYVIFGNVVEGMDVVDAIAEAPVTSNPFGEQSTPVEAVYVQSVEISED